MPSDSPGFPHNVCARLGWWPARLSHFLCEWQENKEKEDALKKRSYKKETDVETWFARRKITTCDDPSIVHMRACMHSIVIRAARLPNDALIVLDWQGGQIRYRYDGAQR
jgi:hypothetical protein